MQSQARRHRVTAEFLDQARMALGDRIERIAHVHAGHRARRAAQPVALGARKRDHRPMQAVLDARGDQTDDALMPVGIEEAQPERQIAAISSCMRRQCRGASSCMRCSISRRSSLSLPELRGKQARAALDRQQQALDAERHVVEPSGGIERGATAKPRSAATIRSRRGPPSRAAP